MKARFLFPRQFRIAGLICLLAWVPFMILKKLIYHGYMNHGVPIRILDNSGAFTMTHFYEIMPIIIILAGLIFMAFSKEKIEDEQISQLRLDSLQWSIYFTYFLFIVSLVFVNGPDFAHNMSLGLWAPLVFFIIRFRWKIYELNRSLKIN
ncbi:MAG: hypothetical protein JWP37_1431 [Mucilaginibacter sp.]|nr:hypothetical protein [Mucilaginibacter sp.]